MFENPYTNQTLQDQIGQLSKLLGAQPAGALPEVPQPAVNRHDLVDGLEGARSFLSKMLPGTQHIVWDSQIDVFYGLQKDANGQPARIKICPYTVELEPTMEEKYVTRSDFDALVSKLDLLLSQKEVTNDG